MSCFTGDGTAEDANNDPMTEGGDSEAPPRRLRSAVYGALAAPARVAGEDRENGVTFGVAVFPVFAPQNDRGRRGSDAADVGVVDAAEGTTARYKASNTVAAGMARAFIVALFSRLT